MASGVSKPLITCRQLVKNYGEGNSLVRALRGVDLDVHGGELTMLVGPSGCGKTTLLLLAGGLLAPTSGRVLVGGVNPYQFSANERAVWRAANLGH